MLTCSTTSLRVINWPIISSPLHEIDGSVCRDSKLANQHRSPNSTEDKRCKVNTLCKMNADKICCCVALVQSKNNGIWASTQGWVRNSLLSCKRDVAMNSKKTTATTIDKTTVLAITKMRLRRNIRSGISFDQMIQRSVTREVTFSTAPVALSI